MSQSSKPIPIALPHALLEKIDLAASRLGISKQEVMRMAMAIGLEHYARINYDIPGVINDAVSIPDKLDACTTAINKLNHSVRILAAEKQEASTVNHGAKPTRKSA